MWAVLKLLWANRELITFILRLLQKGITAIEIQGRLKDFDKAVEIAKDTKDTSKLDDMFGDANKRHP